MIGKERHLAYVLKRFPRISETFIAAELIELQRRGERVTVFAISRPDEPFTHGFLRDLTVPVVYLPHRPAHEPLRVLRALTQVLRTNPGGWLCAVRVSAWPPHLTRIRRLLQATVLRAEMESARVDHAHAHFATAAAGLASLARRMGGPTYSVTTHAKDIYHKEIDARRLRQKLGDAAFVATVTEENRRYLLSILPSSAVHTVPNSVDLRRINPPKERRPEPGLVLSVARLVEKKGLPDLIEACRILRERGDEVRLEIVGDGPLRPELAAQAARGGVPVRFHGALPQEQVLELYARAAVFCLPCVVASTGDRDGLPTSVLEAMASGVPVVTTPVNGLADAVLHEWTGLLAPERNPSALADALGRMLRDHDLAAQLSREAQHHVRECFSLERSVMLLTSLFPEAR